MEEGCGGGGGCKAVVGAYATTGIGEGERGFSSVVQWKGSMQWCEGWPAEEEAGMNPSE